MPGRGIARRDRALSVRGQGRLYRRCPAHLGRIAVRLAPEDPQSASGKALALYTMAVGTLQLSRALSDQRSADEVLNHGLDNALALLR